ncbi:hypothetical protein [Clostridium paraputrificum]|uniref:hypothetical protein n=1 Tax=Clostridium paraputrificum TaxID=29363 RepID=UPI00232DEF23|nr:hypothetical protein [Clostridium paraputrificum]MDB2105871.1 hypothetical protein [Clostridium paraputrificum]MDB2112747.1 hypothetical protein [Clostridium paraputrificum]
MNNKKAPIHLWVIGITFILIYSIGIYDFLMVQGNNVNYLNSLNLKGDVVEYFTNYPFALKILWGINIFSGPLAATLLLLRKKTSIIFAIFAGVSKLILDIITFSFMGRWEVFGVKTSLTDISIILITFIFLIYCIRMRKKGVLK